MTEIPATPKREYPVICVMTPIRRVAIKAAPFRIYRISENSFAFSFGIICEK